MKVKIAIFGATGGTGLEATKQALANGDNVTALVRTPSKLAITDEKLTIIEGNILDQNAVEQVVAGQDAVIVSIRKTDNNPDQLVSKGTRIVIDAMQRFGVQRLVVVTAIGVGDSKNNVPLFFKALMKTILKEAYADMEVQEQAIRESGLDWIVVRPGGLTDNAATGEYEVGLDIKGSQVARADVAAFLLQQITDDTYLRKAVSIS
jgi:putative NADH-flavin reductase